MKQGVLGDVGSGPTPLHMPIVQEQDLPAPGPAVTQALRWIEECAGAEHCWVTAPHAVYRFGRRVDPSRMTRCGWRWIACTERFEPLGVIDLREGGGEVVPAGITSRAPARELARAISAIEALSGEDVVLRSIQVPGQRADLLWLHGPGSGLLFPTHDLAGYPALLPVPFEALPLLLPPDAHRPGGG